MTSARQATAVSRASPDDSTPDDPGRDDDISLAGIGQPSEPDNDHGQAGEGSGGSECSAELSRGGDLPGWWPDIPWPTDADAPPDIGDPPDSPARLYSQPDDEDDDWPQLPSPDWPPLPARLPAAFETAPVRAGADTQRGTVRAKTGLLDVTLPWSSLTGDSCEPGTLGRVGPVTSMQARQLLILAARSPTPEWRVIVTSDDGCALAVERARLTQPELARVACTRAADANVTGVVGRVTIAIRADRLATADDGACPPLLRGTAAAILAAARRAAARADPEAALDSEAGGCAHTTASPAYRPPPRLREYIAARDKTCRFDTCGQPAWRTDIDHTQPWHKGGLTCRCNLGGCCRTHHKIKQLPGWRLEQPQPGLFRWTTPAGRSYQVRPDPYPV